MRHNSPVTQREFPLPAGHNLVSVTDLKGRIVHCNEHFVAASGYAREELLGQPHNLIRHPDMPAEAFRDLWATLSAGRPWTGLVKNRRKDGDHYWVRANVTPVRDGTRTVAYLSVRSVPSRAEVAAADALYRRMNHDMAPARLRNGQLLRPGWRGTLDQAGAALRRHAALLGAAALSSVGWLAATAPLPDLPGGVGWALACGVAMACQHGLARWQARRQAAVLDFARQMAAGDLSTVATAPADADALDTALNQLQVNLQTIVGDIRHEVQALGASVQQLHGSSHHLSERTDSQASSLQQTAASMEQITATVRQHVDHAEHAAAQARQARDEAEQGSTGVQALSRDVEAIATASRKIGEIIGVIDSISFQTNLLALNAAVEAARAGDSGRGFAVVAGEVRALSQRTRAASDQIKTLIDEAVSTVEAGARRAHEVGRTMATVQTHVAEVSTSVEQMRQASTQQLQGIGQVNEAVTRLDGVTQQNASLVDELAQCGQDLLGRAARLQDAVRVFKLDKHAALQFEDAAALRAQPA